MRQVLLSDLFNTEVQKQLIECFDKDGKEKLLLSALCLFFTLSPFMMRLPWQKDDSIPYLTNLWNLPQFPGLKNRSYSVLNLSGSSVIGLLQPHLMSRRGKQHRKK